MDTKWKVVIVTVAVAIPAFALGANAPGGGFWETVWPWASEAEEMSPAAGLVPFFIVLGVVEALSLGLAVSFLAFGMPAARRLAAGSQRRARWVSVSVAWVLGNWWLHDNLHITNGTHMTGLAVIEYAFHLTLIACGAYLAWVVGTSLHQGHIVAPEAAS